MEWIPWKKNTHSCECGFAADLNTEIVDGFTVAAPHNCSVFDLTSFVNVTKPLSHFTFHHAPKIPNGERKNCHANPKTNRKENAIPFFTVRLSAYIFFLSLELTSSFPVLIGVFVNYFPYFMRTDDHHTEFLSLHLCTLLDHHEMQVIPR